MEFVCQYKTVEERTVALQAAIDLATEKKELLVIRPGRYVVGTLKIHAGTHIYLQKGAKIIGSGNYDDYDANVKTFVDAVGRERGRALIYAEAADGAKIYGEGVIDGNGKKHNNAAPPFLMRFVGGKNITLSGITVKNSAAWTIHLLGVDGMTVENVKIRSRVKPNNDGIDIDSCNNITVSNCDISTGDDGICIKTTTHRECSDIYVEGCRISSDWAALKIGTESIGDFRNITIKNCSVYDTHGCGIKVVPVDGANLENLLIENVAMKKTTGPIFISLGKRRRVYFDGDTPREIGSIKNITMRNITAYVVDAKGQPMNGNDYYVTYDGKWGAARGCIVINGLQERAVEDVLIENFALFMPGGVKQYNRLDEEIIEMDEHYPEFSVFGTLPASVVFLRHVKNVEIKNVAYKLKKTDVRPPFHIIDGENSEIS